MAKARGFTTSIEKMNDQQRQAAPSGDYGDDYNQLLRLTEQLYPDLSELLPPRVQIYRGDETHSFSEQSYAEIHTYCEQIFQLLSNQE